MAKMAVLLRAIHSYSGNIMIENPTASSYWNQPFIRQFESDTPNGRSWRSFEMDFCRVGCEYKKRVRIMTTMSAEATGHMHLRCNHPHLHTPLVGRGPDGRPRTAATATYTRDMRALIVGAAAITAGRPGLRDLLATQSDEVHLKRLTEHYRTEELPPTAASLHEEPRVTHLWAKPGGGVAVVSMVGKPRGDTGLVVVRQIDDKSLHYVAITDLTRCKNNLNVIKCSTSGCQRHAVVEENLSNVCAACCTTTNNVTENFTFYPAAMDEQLHSHWQGILEDMTIADKIAIGAADEREAVDAAGTWTTNRTTTEEVHLAQALLTKYWENTKDLPMKPKQGIEGIKFGPDVPPAIRQIVWKAILKHRRVFESAADGRPLTVKTKPHKIRLRKDAKHRRCPEPKWGHGALRHVLTKWARTQLANGSFVMCPKARYGSRPHIVKKDARGATKDAPIVKVRICGDYVYVNSQCESLQSNAPNVPHAVEKASGKPAFWYTDGDNQYNGWAIEEGSRDIAAIWTPIGLIAPTVLQFGLKNAGIVTQGCVRKMREDNLSPYARDHSINYADDFTGFCDMIDNDGAQKIDWRGLAASFIEHLEMADKNNMSFKASKTCFGTNEVEFYGRTINAEGVRYADHNLAPIERMVAPTDQSQLRRVLGLVVQHKDAIEGFGIVAQPLHDLLRNDVEWRWRDEPENKAFEWIRDQCLKNKILCAPDFAKQVFADTDASDDGKGCVIYQLKDPALGDSLENRSILRYYSKAWGQSMRGKPPYYCEGDALCTTIEIGSYYSRATPFPLHVNCDQAPLQWIKTASKGAVTAWRIERINEYDYEVHYKPGKYNITADALSRYPMIGPKTLSRLGLGAALTRLLKSLPESAKNHGTLWFWAAKDTDELKKELRPWSKYKKLVLSAPKSAFCNKRWTLRESSSRVAKGLLKQRKAPSTTGERRRS